MTRSQRKRFDPDAARRCDVRFCDREATHLAGEFTGYAFHVCHEHADAIQRGGARSGTEHRPWYVGPSGVSR
jgi:hypothetical protein